VNTCLPLAGLPGGFTIRPLPDSLYEPACVDPDLLGVVWRMGRKTPATQFGRQSPPSISFVIIFYYSTLFIDIDRMKLAADTPMQVSHTIL